MRKNHFGSKSLDKYIDSSDWILVFFLFCFVFSFPRPILAYDFV